MRILLSIFTLCLFSFSVTAGDNIIRGRAGQIKRIKSKKKVIALTFDDGPNKLVTEKLLEILDKHNVKVTFFEIGRNIKKLPELSRLCAEKGHEIGNHSMNHLRLAELDDSAKIEAEIVGNSELINETVGTYPVSFRAPFFNADEKVADIVSGNGMKMYMASAFCDYKPKEESGLEGHVDRVIGKVKPGSVVILHERPVTLKFLDELIRRLKANGYQFVRVSELEEACN